jgi:hypothetical protein
MIKTLLLSLFILSSTSVLSEVPKDPARDAAEKWSKLMNLVNREIQTIKNNKYSGPELKHRLFELYSEKIKLIKEKENLTLLKADPKNVASNGKESYFKASREQYMTGKRIPPIQPH